MINIDLGGKNILVTGASKGIGSAIARFLLENKARVSLHYNSDREGVQTIADAVPSEQTHLSQADFSDPSSLVSWFGNILEEFGSLDAIVINAGAFIPHDSEQPVQQWYDTWRKTMDINLNASGLITKMAIDHFKERGGGRLIYIGSRAAVRGETQEYLAYAASKGGLTSLAKSVARSFGKAGIKSFVVAPGFTRTDMADQFIEKYGEERVLSEIALNELTLPEDIAPLVGMLCSGLLDHATGATFDINAGSHLR